MLNLQNQQGAASKLWEDKMEVMPAYLPRANRSLIAFNTDSRSLKEAIAKVIAVPLPRRVTAPPADTVEHTQGNN
jgi:hypothetical protein